MANVNEIVKFNEIPISWAAPMSSETALIAVDDDFVHLLIKTDVNLLRYRSASPSFPYLLDECLCVVMTSDQVSVDVDTCLLFGGVRFGDDIAHSQFSKDVFHVFRGCTLRYVDDECRVLDQTAVLSFGSLRRTKSSPLCGVKVTGLEVRLTPGK